MKDVSVAVQFFVATFPFPDSGFMTCLSSFQNFFMNDFLFHIIAKRLNKPMYEE